MNNIITAAEVQEGDKIRVTTVDGDRRNSFEGVANHFKRESFSATPRWITAEDWTLWTDESTAVIELLDRPVPKIELPTGEHAVVKYIRASYFTSGTRLAVKRADDFWVCYDENGERCDGRTTEGLSDMVARNGWKHEVLFAGIAK